MTVKLTIIARILADGRSFTVKGRDAWALSELLTASARGCTSLNNPGPRWSGYVHKLRHQYGLAVETVHEPHRGPFPGTHARYILRTEVEILSRSDQGKARAA